MTPHRLLLTASAVVCAAGAVATASPTASAGPPSSPSFEATLVAEMNQVRADHGLRPLRVSPTLNRPARAHSRYLLRTGRFTHDGPGGTPFFVRLVRAGFPRDRAMAENIAQASGCGPAAAHQTVRMWMASPGHRANLLGPRYRWVGVGGARGGADGCSFTIVTADYGS
jgi:uncharacterized protein YkwD